MRYILADMSDDLISDIISGITRNVASRPDLIFRQLKDIPEIENTSVLKLYCLARLRDRGMKELMDYVAEHPEYQLTDPADSGKHH